jgi:DNA replication protein DnaC
MDISEIKTLQPALTKMAASEREERECLVHGTYTSLLIKGEWSGCVACMHQVDLARENEQREAWRRQLAAREWQRKLGRAAIPEKFHDRTFETYKAVNDGQKAALAKAQRYAANFDEALLYGTSMIFCGTVGTGKTHLAVAIAHEVMKKGRQAVFVKVMKAIDAVRETYAKGYPRTKAQVIRDFVEPELLILDEAGMQRGTDDEKGILFEIIDGRYELSRPTILTSNLEMPALEELFGERSIDRLREGTGRMVPFEWESYRRNPIQREAL